MRVIKPNQAIVLTASQPFISFFVSANVKHFRREWIWHKSHARGHLGVKHQLSGILTSNM